MLCLLRVSGMTWICNSSDWSGHFFSSFVWGPLKCKTQPVLFPSSVPPLYYLLRVLTWALICDLAAMCTAVCMQCSFFFLLFLSPSPCRSSGLVCLASPDRWQPEVRGQRAKLTPSIPLDSYKRALNSGQNNPWIMQDGLEVGREGESECLARAVMC